MGNTAFLRPFSHLELQGCLRCATFFINRGTVPEFPTYKWYFQPLPLLPRVGRIIPFWHVGLQVELRDKAKYSVHILPAHETCFGLLFHDLYSIAALLGRSTFGAAGVHLLFHRLHSNCLCLRGLVFWASLAWALTSIIHKTSTWHAWRRVASLTRPRCKVPFVVHQHRSKKKATHVLRAISCCKYKRECNELS